MKEVNERTSAIKKDVESISGLAQSIKYVLRGTFFVLYFPFYFVFQIFCKIWIYLIANPLIWIGKRIIQPVIYFIWIYIIRFLFVYPISWLWNEIIYPFILFVWERCFLPITRFIWRYAVYPILYLVCYPCYLFWKYLVLPFYNEIVLPVLSFCQRIFFCFWKGFKWIGIHIIYYPLRWFWVTCIYKPLKKVYIKIIQPVLKWFSHLFS